MNCVNVLTLQWVCYMCVLACNRCVICACWPATGVLYVHTVQQQVCYPLLVGVRLLWFNVPGRSKLVVKEESLVS